MIIQNALVFITNSNKFASAIANYPANGAFCRSIDIKIIYDENTKSVYYEAYFDYGDPGQSPNDILAKVKYDNGDFKDLYVTKVK